MFDLFGCRAITIYKICIRQPPINSNMPKVIFPKRKARFREKKYESNLSGPFSFLLSFYQKLIKTIKKRSQKLDLLFYIVYFVSWQYATLKIWGFIFFCPLQAL